LTRAQVWDRVGFAVYFALAGLLGRLSVLPDTSLALIWPATGIAAAWFAVTGWSRWLILDAGLLLVLAYAVNAATGLNAVLAAGLALSLLVQILVFGLAATRWCPSWWGFRGDPPAGVESLRDFGFLIVAGFGSAVVAAVLGPALAVSITDADGSVIVSWILRDGVGMIAVFPVALYVLHLVRARVPDRGPAAVGPLRGRGRTELVLLIGYTMLLASYVFVINDDLPVPFLMLLTSVWAGTRFSTGIAGGHTLMVSACVVASTVLEYGPFLQIADPGQRAVVVQSYLAMTVVLAYAMSVGRRESLLLSDRLARSEREATAQAALVRAIVDAMSDGVSVIDAEGNLVMRNPASRELLGDPQRDEEGALDIFAYGFRHADGRRIDPEEHPMVLAVGGEATEKAELLLRSPASPDRFVQVSALPLPDQESPLVVVVFHDVTAERRERDELASFAGVVAHDLLNPITVVEGWTESILEDLRAGEVIKPDDGIAKLERVQRAADRMQRLISDLLEFTTARDRVIDPVRVDLEEVVRDVARTRIDAGGDGGEPVIEVDGPLPDVLAEPVLLRQVIDNIVGNAVKYVAPGVRPEIRVRAERVAPDSARGPMVEIEIADNGIGIPEGQHAQVFDSFHRVHQDGYGGTGLGLSIVKRIVERHGGTAAARSNAGGGTTMCVSFPAVD